MIPLNIHLHQAFDTGGADPAASSQAAVRAVFMKHHADLLDAAFWQSHKDRIQAGHVLDIFPYDRDKRFAPAGRVAERFMA